MNSDINFLINSACHIARGLSLDAMIIFFNISIRILSQRGLLD